MLNTLISLAQLLGWYIVDILAVVIAIGLTVLLSLAVVLAVWGIADFGRWLNKR